MRSDGQWGRRMFRRTRDRRRFQVLPPRPSHHHDQLVTDNSETNPIAIFTGGSCSRIHAHRPTRLETHRRAHHAQFHSSPRIAAESPPSRGLPHPRIRSFCSRPPPARLRRPSVKQQPVQSRADPRTEQTYVDELIAGIVAPTPRTTPTWRINTEGPARSDLSHPDPSLSIPTELRRGARRCQWFRATSAHEPAFAAGGHSELPPGSELGERSSVRG